MCAGTVHFPCTEVHSLHKQQTPVQIKILLNPQPEFNERGKDFGMTDLTPTPRYYSRGVARGDIKNATEVNPARIIRYEFVARQFDAYLDPQGHYCEKFVSEFPEVTSDHTRSDGTKFVKSCRSG